MHLLWPSHFDAVFLGPSLAQRHHEVRDEAHLFKLPLPVLLDILVVTIAQVADRLAIAELLHLSLQFLDPCFGILCHRCPLLIKEFAVVPFSTTSWPSKERGCLVGGGGKIVCVRLPLRSPKR